MCLFMIFFVYYVFFLDKFELGNVKYYFDIYE